MINSPHYGTVHSSGGTLRIRLDTGELVGMTDVVDKGYSRTFLNITRFDLDEYREYYTDVGDSHADDSFDILDLGYWLEDGTYEPPAQDWRNEVKARLISAKKKPKTMEMVSVF